MLSLSLTQDLGVALLCFALALAGYVLPTEWRRYQIRREMRDMERSESLRKVVNPSRRTQ